MRYTTILNFSISAFCLYMINGLPNPIYNAILKLKLEGRNICEINLFSLFGRAESKKFQPTTDMACYQQWITQGEDVANFIEESEKHYIFHTNLQKYARHYPQVKFEVDCNSHWMYCPKIL